MRKFSIAKILLLALTCAVVAGGILYYRFQPLQRLEFYLFDLYSALVSTPAVEEKFAAVLATERSMKKMHQWPWARSNHARVLGQLGLARLVVMDILFPEKTSEPEDKALTEVTRLMGNVILPAHLAPDAAGSYSSLVLPFPELFEAAKGVGIANILPEADGIYRDGVLFWQVGDDLIPSLPLEVFSALRGDASILKDEKTGRYGIELTGGLVWLEEAFRYKIIHPRTEITCYEYVDLLDGLVSPDVFKDCVVFVGVSATGAEDYFSVGAGKVVPGTLYNAHAALALLHGQIPIPCPPWADAAAGAIMACAGLLTGLFAETRRSWLIFAVLILAWPSFTAGLFFGGLYWVPTFSPLIAGAVSYFGAICAKLSRLFDEWRIRELPIASLLLLGEKLPDVDEDFRSHMRGAWRGVEERTGVSLLCVGVDEQHRVAAECLEKISKDSSGNNGALPESMCVLLDFAEGKHRYRLLIPLPSPDPDKKEFAVLGWSKAQKEDRLRTLAAMVLSSAVYFRAIEENREKKELFFNVIRAMIGAVDAKDSFTAGHSERVASLACELAAKMGLSQKETEEIRIAGILHDVGKIAIPDSILNKSERLSEEEMFVVRGHPLVGAVLMDPIAMPEAIVRGILEHHERPDGKGYPNGLAGKERSLTGQILKVADVFDALTSRRQYKEPWEAQKAYKILTEGRGTEFDEAVVDTLLANPFSER